MFVNVNAADVVKRVNDVDVVSAANNEYGELCALVLVIRHLLVLKLYIVQPEGMVLPAKGSLTCIVGVIYVPPLTFVTMVRVKLEMELILRPLNVIVQSEELYVPPVLLT